MRKIPFAGIELTSQRVRGLRGTSELPGRPHPGHYIILLTQCYYYYNRGTRLNAMKRFCLCSLRSHLNDLTFFPPEWGVLRRSTVDAFIFFFKQRKTHFHNSICSEAVQGQRPKSASMSYLVLGLASGFSIGESKTIVGCTIHSRIETRVETYRWTVHFYTNAM